MAVICLILFSLQTFSQDRQLLKGRVRDETGNGIESALLIFLPGGKASYSDSVGFFQLDKPAGARMLLVSAAGYKRDTVFPEGNFLEVTLHPAKVSNQEILVTGDRGPGQFKIRSAALEINIDRQELRKAACCNLSESFESSPMVDVSFPDPISGVRQIKMLGLGSQYTNYSIENQIIPNGVLGSSAAGLIPGPWLESIQVQKGSGPVSSGYSGLGGQINSAYLKSDTSSKTESNVFASTMGRAEGNLVSPLRRSTQGGTTLFLHGNYSALEMDQNQDGYRDLPVGHQANAMVRSNHALPENGTLKFAAHAYRDERAGGVLGYMAGSNPIKGEFGYHSLIKGLDLSGKAGKILKSDSYRSLGLQWAAGSRSNSQTAGGNMLSLDELFFSADPVFQADIGRRGSGIKAGLTIAGRQRKEHLEQIKWGQTFHYHIAEKRAGGFLEFTAVPSAGLLLVAGSRLDWHNFYGWRHSPRLHLRYEASDGLILRINAGQAWQDPEIFAHNLPFFSSGRKLILTESDSRLPYGIRSEKGRSLGFSGTYSYRLLPGKGNVTLDAFISQLENQVLADPEEAGFLRIYNASGKTQSSSFAAQIDQKFSRIVSVRMAYRFTETRSEYMRGRLAAPLQSFHRFFVHTDIQPVPGLKLNTTFQFHGKKRIYGSNNMSPDFITAHFQISKVWKKFLETALGIENLTGYRQQELIVFKENPGSEYFDAARIWGPSVGAMLYFNLRFSY